MQKPKTETYKCMNERCGFEFKAAPGPVVCNQCGSEYVQWVSYPEYEKRTRVEE
jgi:hypothetical protein